MGRGRDMNSEHYEQYNIYELAGLLSRMMHDEFDFVVEVDGTVLPITCLMVECGRITLLT